MGEFDEFIRSEPEEVPKAEPRVRPTAPRRSNTQLNKSLTEMILGESSPHQFAEKFGLDEEMTQKVLVPLLNFLDKYEIGSGIGESPTAQGVMDLSTVVADVAPVVKNAAEYFSGRNAALSEDDAAFLAKIRESQGEGMDLFFTEDEEIGEVAEEESVSEDPVYTGVVPIDADPFQEGIDWATILDAPEFKPKDQSFQATYTDMMPKPDLMIKGLEDLAKEAGLDPTKVAASGHQARTNSGTQATPEQQALAQGDASGIQLDLSSIREEMDAENQHRERTSKVNFEADVMVPENLEDYDPLTVPGFTLPPTPITNLETVEEMAARENINLDDDESDTVTEVDPHEIMDNEGGAIASEVGDFESEYFGAVAIGESHEEE